jgi:methyl-accepting chemotaxis protein
MLVDEVSEASKQQMQGINQVSTAVIQVSKVTQEAAATAQQTAAGAIELSSRSKSVLGLVNQLQTMVDGGSGHDTPLSPVARPNSGGRTVSGSRTSRRSNTSPEDLFPLETPGNSGFRSF